MTYRSNTHTHTECCTGPMGVITGREREKEDKIQYKLIKMLREYIVHHLSSGASKRNWTIVGLQEDQRRRGKINLYCSFLRAVIATGHS